MFKGGDFQLITMPCVQSSKNNTIGAYTKQNKNRQEKESSQGMPINNEFNLNIFCT